MNRIHHLELNFDSHAIADESYGPAQDVSLWSQHSVLPLVDAILEQEWKKISRQWPQSSQKTIPDIRIHHLQLQIQAESTQSFKQEFCRCFTQELKAAIRYSMHCDRDKWSPGFTTAGTTGSPSSGVGVTLENVLRIVFSGGNTAHCDASALKLLARYWQQWAQQEPAALRNGIVEYLQQAPNRKRVASQFPEALQNQIMVLLEPTQADYILRVIAGLSTLDPVRIQQHVSPRSASSSNKTNISDKTAISNKTDSDLLPLNPCSSTSKNDTPTRNHFSACLSRRYLVEFSLTYMTCERGSRFNRKIYMRSVIRQMAQHNNMDSRTLSQHLREILHNVDSSHILKQELLEILQPDDYLGATVDRCEPEIGHVIELDYHRAIRTVTQGLTQTNIEGDTERAFIHSVSYLLHHNPHDLVALLRRVNSVANTANVLVNLPEKIQAQLCQHLCASAYHYLEPYHALISSLWRRGQGETVNQTQLLAHVTLVFFLNSAINNNTNNNIKNNAPSVSPLSASQNWLRHYLESVLQGLSSLTGRSVTDLKQSFQEAPCINQKESLWRDIQQGLNPLKTPPTASVSNLPQQALNDVSQPIANGADQHNVFTPLVKAIQQGDWNISAAHWRTIKSGNVKTIRSLLCLLMQPRAVRQRVVSNLPLAIQAELVGILVGILEGNAQEMIQGVWQSTAAIHNLINGFSATTSPQYKGIHTCANHSSGTTSNSLALAVREFTFSYLVIERGSEFNQRSFARSVLRQLSGRYNVNYQALLGYLQGHLAHAELPNALATHWRAILGLELSHTPRSPGSAVTQPALTAFETPPVITWAQQMSLGQEGAAFFSDIVALLTATSPPNLGRWKVLINALADRHSLYFKRLAQRISYQFIPNENLYRNLSVAALMQLANRCLTLNGVGGQSCSALKYSIEKYAIKANDRRAFYVTVIGALLQGRLIDLEHLLTSANNWQPQPNPALATVAIPPKHIAAKETLSQNPIAINTPSPSATTQSIAKNNVMLMSQSLESVLGMAGQGEAVLIDYCYRVDAQKMQRLYPVAQVLRLILAHCQTTLLAIENGKGKGKGKENQKDSEWAGTFQPNNRLHEKQWLAVIFHGLAVQLVVAKCVSVDWFIQQTVRRVFKLWQLDPKNFAMDGFLQSAIRHLYAGNYSADMPFNHIMQSTLQSLTVADIGMEEAEPITPSEHVALMPSPPLNTGASHGHNHSHSRGESEQQTRLNPESAVECDKRIALEYEKGDLVESAGVVVLAPYLAVLFERMALLKDQTIKATEQGKALQLLYYLSHGECAASVSFPSLWGLFNAICGIKPNTLVPLPNLTQEEQNSCDELLKAVIQHWRVLGATSVEGLRETFLQRWGELRLVDDKGWELKVEAHPLDVLLDRLPWGFSVIKYPFMEEAVHVQWR